MRGLKVAVAGCGPCGLATALLLSRQGHRVALFERFDAPRPIGSGLMIQPTGLAVLDKLGLSERLISEGARIERLFGTAGQRTVLDVRYEWLGPGDWFGVGVHRSTLFDVLHDALVDEGIPILTGTTISGSRLETKGRRIIFESGGASEPYDLVIDALGTRSLLAEPCGRELAYGALWATLDWPHGAGFDLAALQQRYQRSKIMIGLLPIGIGRSGQSKAAFFWSLKCDQLDQWRAAGLDAWKADVRSLWWEMDPVLDQIIDAEQLTFARYSHRTLRRSAEPALIHLGDAWHSASPQLGQGANMAMLDAWSLARALERSANMDEALRVAVKMRRRHIQLYQWLTAIFTPVYQSDSRVLPFLRDRIVGPLSKIWPATWIQAAMVSGLIGNPLPGLGLDAGCRAP